MYVVTINIIKNVSHIANTLLTNGIRIKNKNKKTPKKKNSAWLIAYYFSISIEPTTPTLASSLLAAAAVANFTIFAELQPTIIL